MICSYLEEQDSGNKTDTKKIEREVLTRIAKRGLRVLLLPSSRLSFPQPWPKLLHLLVLHLLERPLRQQLELLGEATRVAEDTSKVPASITIPEGATFATFQIKTRAVTSSSNVTISATLDSTTKVATLTLTP